MKKIKLSDGNKYVPVKERVLYLSRNNIDYQVVTSITDLPPLDGTKQNRVRCKAELKVFKPDGSERLFQGTRTITIDPSNPVSRQYAQEWAETAAVGRACAFAGIGIEDAIASLEEMSQIIPKMEGEPPAENKDDKGLTHSEKVAAKLDHIQKVPTKKEQQKHEYDPKESPADQQKKDDAPVEQPDVVSEDEKADEELTDDQYTEAIKQKVYTEDELMDMGTTPAIYAIADAKGVDLEALKADGKRLTNKKIRLAILDKQGSAVPDQEKEIIEEAAKEDEDGQTSIPENGNVFNIFIPAVPESGERNFMTETMQMMRMFDEKEIAEAVEQAFTESELIDNYGDYENFLSTATVDEINFCINKIK